MSIFFLPHLQDHGLLRCRNFATKGQGLYLSVTFFVELIIRRGSYIQCMKRLRKGENICVLFENPTHCSIGTAARRNKCRDDHGSNRCSSQSRNCVFNCNDLLCIQFMRVDRTLCHHLSMRKIIIMLRHNFMQKSGITIISSTCNTIVTAVIIKVIENFITVCSSADSQHYQGLILVKVMITTSCLKFRRSTPMSLKFDSIKMSNARQY